MQIVCLFVYFRMATSSFFLYLYLIAFLNYILILFNCHCSELLSGSVLVKCFVQVF
jgi:hypothetical protein